MLNSGMRSVSKWKYINSKNGPISPGLPPLAPGRNVLHHVEPATRARSSVQLLVPLAQGMYETPTPLATWAILQDLFVVLPCLKDGVVPGLRLFQVPRRLFVALRTQTEHQILSHLACLKRFCTTASSAGHDIAHLSGCDPWRFCAPGNVGHELFAGRCDLQANHPGSRRPGIFDRNPMPESALRSPCST